MVVGNEVSLPSPDTLRLPPEAWQDIISFVNATAWLDGDEMLEDRVQRIELLRSLSLTSSIFRRLAQPLLCSELNVNPFTWTRAELSNSLGPIERIALPEDVVEDNILRLIFFASDRIAPHVRIIRVRIARHRPGPRVKDRGLVLRTLISHLHHFIHLQQLVFDEQLPLQSDDFILPPCAHRALPLLRYAGPWVLFPLFGKQPTLIHLHTKSLEQSGFDDAAHLLAALSHRDITSHVYTLSIKINCLSKDIIQSLFYMFPRLKDLSIEVREHFFQDVAVVPVSIESCYTG
jgi:hypothetical protein